MTRQLSIDDAARVLGISQRTVQRHLIDGILQGVKTGQKWAVDVPDETNGAPEPRHDDNRHVTDRLGAQLAETSQDRDSLACQLDTVTRERDDLARDKSDMARQIDALIGERDYLRNLAAALATKPPLLSERTDKRPWWAMWRR